MHLYYHIDTTSCHHLQGFASAAVSLPSFYRGDLQGPVNVTVDLSTGLITFKNLSVSSSGVNYVLKVSVTITVSNNYIQQSLETDGFDVVDPASAVTDSGETVTLTLRFDADYDMVAAGQEEALKIYFLNHMASQYKNVTFSNVVISEGEYIFCHVRCQMKQRWLLKRSKNPICYQMKSS